jgi:hypothetical protein
MRVSMLGAASVVVAGSLFFLSCSCSSSKSTSATDSASSSENFVKQFAGNINNKTEIEMKLNRQGDSLSGSYVYKRIGVDIPIKGTISGQHFLIKEYGGKDGSQTGFFEGDFASAGEISGNWSNASGDKVMVFSLREKATTVSGATPTQSASSTSPTPASTSAPSQPAQTTTKVETGQLTTDKVQRAVDKALDWTRKGGRATVLGIQEIPRENAARADVRFDGFQYNANSYDMPISKDQKTPPEPDIRDPKWSEKMYQNRAGQVHIDTYSGQGAAILKHYTDGRWVLTGVQFGFHGVDANIEVR